MPRLSLIHLIVATLLALGGRAGAADAQTAPATQAVPETSQAPRGSADGDAGAEEQRLLRLIDAGARPLDNAAARLALANWLIARPIAEPATRWLLGMHSPQDLQLIGAHAARAREQLDAAARALEPQDPDTDRRRDLRATLRTLSPFVNLLKAAPSETATLRAAAGDAALELAGARESDKTAVASSALLWQAYAWDLAGKPARSLTTLPEALKPPKELSHEFIARLLRCRILAESGEYAAALALLVRLRTVCGEWFPADPPRDIEARERLAAVLQERLARAWRDKVASSTGRTPEKLDELVKQLRGGLAEQAPVYSLDAAVPVLAEAPEAEAAGGERPGSSSPTGTSLSAPE